ncbi:hypothetical protein CI102_1436 [Trichoderma harzianum]|nr:hypothetical protein CI102_1436 [Trichoderma harzianum]
MFLSCIACLILHLFFSFPAVRTALPWPKPDAPNIRRPSPSKRAINPIDLPLSRRSIDPSILVRCCTQASLARARAIPPNPIPTA